MVHRVATSDMYHSSLIEIQRDWTLDDLLDAVLVIERVAEARWGAENP